MRASESAIDTSGSLPMSSADTESTITVALRLVRADASSDPRMPVTTIVPASTSSGAVAPGATGPFAGFSTGAFCAAGAPCANAGVAATVSAAALAPRISAVRRRMAIVLE